jgi:hypothetical protein
MRTVPATPGHALRQSVAHSLTTAGIRARHPRIGLEPNDPRLPLDKREHRVQAAFAYENHS